MTKARMLKYAKLLVNRFSDRIDIDYGRKANDRLATAWPISKRIRLNSPCLELSRIELKDTILHEIAHILSPIHAHHDKTWKTIAKGIGCNGERLYDPEYFQKG